MINIAIRAAYYIFCWRNRNWDSPDLHCNAILIFSFLFSFFLLFCCCFFLIIQSQAAFVNCLYVARFTIVHSKTQVKFPLLIVASNFISIFIWKKLNAVLLLYFLILNCLFILIRTLNILLPSTARFAMIYSINYLQVFVTSALDQETFKKQVGI